MALYIPHSILHLAWLLYVRPETFGPYYIRVTCPAHLIFLDFITQCLVRSTDNGTVLS